MYYKFFSTILYDNGKLELIKRYIERPFCYAIHNHNGIEHVHILFGCNHPFHGKSIKNTFESLGINKYAIDKCTNVYAWIEYAKSNSISDKIVYCNDFKSILKIK